MVDFARYFLDFAQKESCGECVPCRLGTKQMLDILEDITDGQGPAGRHRLAPGTGRGRQPGSLCGLGQTAPNPVLTTIRYFRDEYEAHIRQKRCPAVVCKEIISSPCQHVCPIDTQAAGLHRPDRPGAVSTRHLQTIVDDNPLPSVCARVCHHPCEANCQAGKWGSPVAVRALKRAAVDYAVARASIPRRDARTPGRKGGHRRLRPRRSDGRLPLGQKGLSAHDLRGPPSPRRGLGGFDPGVSAAARPAPWILRISAVPASRSAPTPGSARTSPLAISWPTTRPCSSPAARQVGASWDTERGL